MLNNAHNAKLPPPKKAPSPFIRHISGYVMEIDGIVQMAYQPSDMVRWTSNKNKKYSTLIEFNFQEQTCRRTTGRLILFICIFYANPIKKLFKGFFWSMKYGGKVAKSVETKTWSHSYRQNAHSICEENPQKTLFATGIWFSCSRRWVKGYFTVSCILRKAQFCKQVKTSPEIFRCSVVQNLVMDFEILFVTNACLILQKTNGQILIPKLCWKQFVVCEVVSTPLVELRIYKLDLFHYALMENHITRATVARRHLKNIPY